MQKQGKNSKKEHVPITQCQQWSRSASSQISSQFSNFPKCHAKCMLSQLSRVWLFGTLKPTRLLCPWDSPEKNTGVGCHVLLQGIFPTQGSNLCLLQLLHWAGKFFTTSATREALMSHNFFFTVVLFESASRLLVAFNFCVSWISPRLRGPST